MSLGIFTPAMSKNVGAKSMFKTISFILDENKISNKVRLSFHNKRLKPLTKGKWRLAHRYHLWKLPNGMLLYF